MEIQFDKEFVFKTSRSGGKGGQNVNKVSTKVELNFDVVHSFLLSEEEKGMILLKLKNRINKEGVLQIVSDSERTQLANKKIVIKRFYKLMELCFAPEKERKATRPTLSSQRKRLKDKKRQAIKKENRTGNKEELGES